MSVLSRGTWTPEGAKFIVLRVTQIKRIRVAMHLLADRTSVFRRPVTCEMHESLSRTGRIN